MFKWGSQRGGLSNVEVGDMIGVAGSLQPVTPTCRMHTENPMGPHAMGRDENEYGIGEQ